MFFLHYLKTPKSTKLKLSDFKDTIFKTHYSIHTSWLHSELLSWQQNYKRYLAEFGSIKKQNFE